MTPSKVSVFIPVYRESDLLRPLLSALINDPYGEKEIFVIVDEPTVKSREISRDFHDPSIHFIFNGERMGKANVLNEAVSMSDGDILLFLDGDVVIPEDVDGSFLGRVVEAMVGSDIVELKKRIIRDSLLARLVYYDYLSFNSSNLLFSNLIGRCLGLNGAAFAIRREVFERLGGFRRVISEDLDIGTRSFIMGYRFSFLEDVEVLVKVSSSWGQWLNQRKRWGIGAALWLKEYLREILRNLKRYPKVLLPSLLLILPSLPLFAVSILIPNELYLKVLSLSLIVLATKGSGFLFPPIIFTSSIIALKNAVAVMLNFSSYLLIFYLFARKLNYPFKPLDFTLFYFIYSPIWLFIIIFSIVMVYFRRGQVKVDWKI